MRVDSPEFTDDGAIPARFTCEGANTAPPLRFADVPEGAKSLALIVDDPDAPDPKAPKRTWVHWVAYNLPADCTGLPEGGALPSGARDGLNDWMKAGYGGPCPPIGRHRYVFKLYALDRPLELREPKKAELEQAMKGHVLAQAKCVGTYEKMR